MVLAFLFWVLVLFWVVVLGFGFYILDLSEAMVPKKGVAPPRAGPPPEADQSRTWRLGRESLNKLYSFL